MAPPPNTRFVDRFSLVHATWGAVAELSGVPAPVGFAAAVGFELVENRLKRAYSGFFPDDAPDGWQNQVGDVAAFGAGYYLARALKKTDGGKAAIILLGALAGAIWLDRLAAKPALPAAQRQQFLR